MGIEHPEIPQEPGGQLVRQRSDEGQKHQCDSLTSEPDQMLLGCRPAFPVSPACPMALSGPFLGQAAAITPKSVRKQVWAAETGPGMST